MAKVLSSFDAAMKAKSKATHLRVLSTRSKTLPKGFGAALPNLLSLEILGGALADLGDELAGCARLETLALSSLPLRKLSKDVGALARLNKLVLERLLEMPVLPSNLGALEQLRSLRIQALPIKALPVEIGGLAALETLVVYNTRLEKIPASFGGLQALKHLEVSGAKLDGFPASLGALRSLEVLVLAGQLLTSLPDEIGELASLRRLGLGANRFEAVPRAVKKLPALSSLMLGQNRISNLSALFESPSAATLRSLDLSDAQVTSLAGIESFAALSELWLDRTKLQSLAPLLELPTLGDVYLRNATADGKEVTALRKRRVTVHA